ncbi:hypothetical protein GOBAR_AA27087 [Gossypium barbadense]|uniref:FAD-binding PCMH-type domain-containing protein n=1 Tax=Gossypium barbadense TaxID=3634 RepID=A0A2P5WR98_GOSBA|nr:hypothetical protein GOBAR_AA27087 [Gossypium barbadense]
MAISWPLVVSVLLSISSLVTSASNSDSVHEAFVQCLLDNSHPSHPISEAIFTPQSPSYATVLQSYIRNLRFNETYTPKPFLILTALHQSHIQAAIICAKKGNIQMKIRSGGHDYDGLSYVATVPFFVLDMFNLRSIDIDTETETVWVQSGAILGELYYRISELSKTHGFPAGVCPTVGVGGHFTGGGYGNMMRKYGLTVDNIVDAYFIDVNVHEAFVQCLLDNSHPSHPISEAIFTPQSPSYATVLQSYIRNLRFNETYTPKPFLILTALHQSHIQAAIICAKKGNIQMKIRSGGHDYDGLSYVATVPFFVLDMFNLRSIDIDTETETVWVQSGAILGELYYRISELSKTHGFPAGVCPTVGVGGHFTGGGYGNMMRKYGLTVDNIVDAYVIDVNGRIHDRKSMGEDLFWAIRGGGAASFGVVLAYKIKLVHVPEIVTVFRVEKTLEDNATDIVDQWQHVASKLPKELFVRLVIDVVNSSTRTGGSTVRVSFISLFLGDSKTLVSIMNENLPLLGLSQSDCIETSWIRSVLFWTNITIDSPTDVLLNRTPSLSYLKRKSDYVKQPIPKTALEGIWEKMIELQPAQMIFNPYGGRMAEIESTATPFPHRAGNLWKIQYLANWNQGGAETAQRYIGLTRKLHRYMTPFVSKNPREAFLNYRDIDLGVNHNDRGSYLEGRVYGIKYFKGNFNRLVHIKTKVDPTNFFRNEQSIPTLPH